MLPGIRFETQERALRAHLPRLDIAALVGFAAAGPVDLPVPVEDLERFRDIYGPDLPLAWSPERGAWQHALLGPAVEAFFANGGVRCWVVRVAESPYQHRFRLPGLYQADGVTPVTARARSEGSWAESLRVDTALERLSLELLSPLELPVGPAPLRIDVAVSPDQLHPGELVEVRFVPDGLSLWLFVDRFEPVEGGLRLIADETFWVDQPALASPASPAGSPPAPAPSGWELLSNAEGEARLAALAGASPAPPPVVSRLRLELAAWSAAGVAGRLRDLALHPEHPRFWGRLPHDAELFEPKSGRLDLPLPQPVVELLEQASQPRFPLAGEAGASISLPLGVSPRVGREGAQPAIEDAGAPATALERDGLASFGSHLFLDARLRERFTGGLLAEAEHHAWVRGERLRGIHALHAVEEATLLAVPDALHRGWTRDSPPLEPPLEPPTLAPPEQPLSGEDCWWVRWSDSPGAERYRLESSPGVDFERPAVLYQGPDTSRCVDLAADCPRRLHLRVRAENDHETSPWSNHRGALIPEIDFADCDRPVAPELLLELLETGSPADQLELSWLVDASGPAPSGPFDVELEVAVDASFLTATILDTVSGAAITLDPTSLGGGAGRRFFRARALVDGHAGPWSNTVWWSAPLLSDWTLLPIEEFSDDDLLDVHRSALRLGGARRDLMAVLALPEHYRTAEALEHLRRLRPGPPTGPGASFEVPPLQPDERPVLGFGALYHPWLATRPEPADDGSFELRWGPPEGAVLGLLAATTRREGAWIAPANRPLRGVVALEPELDLDAWRQLAEAGIDLIREEPRGFVPFGSDTLTTEAPVRPINVRRLLILLRRLALREGASYVFEPNDDDLRSRIRHRFERVLSELYVRGAFVGRQPRDAYRVGIETASSALRAIERGRLIVELLVAPAHPLTFLTVRLIQEAPGELTVEEG